MSPSPASSVDMYEQATLSTGGKKVATKETILEKIVTFAGHEITMFSLDGQTWTSNENELDNKK